VNIFYIDEQEDTFGDDDYTAVCAASITAQGMVDFRQDYFPKLYEMVAGIRGTETGTVDVSNLVHIHGSDLLRDFRDEKKIEILELLLSRFSAHHGKLYRLGYRNKTLPHPIKQSRQKRILFCVQSLLFSLENVNAAPYAFVSEMDREGLKKLFEPVSGSIPLAYILDQNYGTENDEFASNVSIDYKNFVGHFFADKLDIGCQLADVGGYLALKADSAESWFAQKLAKIFHKYRSLFEVNEIISLNEMPRKKIDQLNRDAKYRPLRG